MCITRGVASETPRLPNLSQVRRVLCPFNPPLNYSLIYCFLKIKCLIHILAAMLLLRFRFIC